MQRLAVSGADAIVAVSPSYLEDLRSIYHGHRFRWLMADRQAVLPFAGSKVDIETARRRVCDLAGRAGGSPENAPTGGKLTLIYVGAGGITRLKAWEAICQAAIELRKRNPELIERCQFRLYGTTSDPKASDAGLLEQTAEACGVSGLVAESPAHVSYLRSLELAHGSSGLVVLGVDAANYMPSKLFNYLLFDQPVLAVCHAQSPAADFLRSRPSLAHLICFDPERPIAPEPAADVLEAYLRDVAAGQKFSRTEHIAEYLAPAMAHAHAALFARCI
jgi:hypothetical protein